MDAPRGQIPRNESTATLLFENRFLLELAASAAPIGEGFIPCHTGKFGACPDENEWGINPLPYKLLQGLPLHPPFRPQPFINNKLQCFIRMNISNHPVQ